MIAEGFEYYLPDLENLISEDEGNKIFISKLRHIMRYLKREPNGDMFQYFIDIDETYRDIFNKSILD